MSANDSAYHSQDDCLIVAGFLYVIMRYLASLSAGKMVLWCYFFWYCVTVVNHFDANPSIWINSVGISVVIGIALVLSVSGTGHQNRDGWQTFRLFLMPFCVSSFSSLIKGKGFFLILPPTMLEIVTSIGVCLGFCTIVMVIKRTGCFSKRCSSSVT